MKKVVCLVLALAMVFALVACTPAAPASQAPASQAPASQAPASEAKVVVGFSPTSMRDYYVAVKQGVDEEAAAQGFEVLSYDPNGDATLQAQQLNDMVTAGAKGLVVVSINTGGMRNTFAELKEAGAIIAVVDAEIPMADRDVVDAHITSNNTMLGELSGEDAAKRYPQGANVIIVHATIYEGCVLTVNGFWDKIKEFAPDPAKFVELTVVDAEGTTDSAYPKCVDAMQAYGDKVNLFYCINDPHAIAVIRAVEETGKKVGLNIDAGEIAVYGKDASPEGKKLIKEGKLVQSSAQSPIGLGKMGVKRIADKLAGTAFERDEFLPSVSITADNVDEYGVDTWQ